MPISVPRCTEWRRINDLPLRAPPDVTVLRDTLTRAFSRDPSKHKLWDTQARVLGEWITAGGCWAKVPVGGGKTLMLFLAAWFVTGRAVLLVPSRLREKTLAEYRELKKQWRLRNDIFVLGTSSIQTVKGAERLERLAPIGCLLVDEAHLFKRKSSARSRRFFRFLRKHPETKVLVASGSFQKSSLMDWHHLANAALRERSPVPRTVSSAELWADAIDPGVDSYRRPDAGALRCWAGDEGRHLPTVQAARLGVRNRLLFSAGCVLAGSPEVSATLEIHEMPINLPSPLKRMIERLRDTWETPQGDLLMQASDVRRVEQELSLGCWYRWDPPPPDTWMQRRRAWHRIIRDLLGRNRDDCDSPKQVELLVQSDSRFRTERVALAAWVAVKPSYTPNIVVQWESEYLVSVVRQWLAKEPGLVWVDFTAIGRLLSDRLRLPYFGAGHEAAHGVRTHRDPAIVSRHAHATGHNLQRYSRSLVTTPPASNEPWEQLLGRMHRPGQLKTTRYDVCLLTDHDRAAMRRALEEADSVEHIHGDAQKLRSAYVAIELDLDSIDPAT